jgi:hypothetical protein
MTGVRFADAAWRITSRCPSRQCLRRRTMRLATLIVLSRRDDMPTRVATLRAGAVVSRSGCEGGRMMGRPFGVIVLGALSIAIATVRFVVGLQLLGFVIFGPAQTGDGLVLAGLLVLLMGAIYLAVGWALWSLRPWALLFAMIMAVFGLVDAVFVMLATGSVAYGLAAAAIPALLLWYTSREDIQRTFAANA